MQVDMGPEENENVDVYQGMVENSVLVSYLIFFSK